MQIEEGKLLDGTIYREFVVLGLDGRERFSARLMLGSKTIEICWTENLPWTLKWLREIFVSCGKHGTITHIRGMASDELERLIQSGEFSSQQTCEWLNKYLHGNWAIEIIQRKSGIFDLSAHRREHINHG